MGWAIVREPEDELIDVRLSIGTKKRLGSYMVFRGDHQDVIDLLEETLAQARVRLMAGDYYDKRGRPQG